MGDSSLVEGGILVTTKTFIDENNLLDKASVDSLLSVLEDESVVQVEKLSNVIILQEEDKIKDFVDRMKKVRGI